MANGNGKGKTKMVDETIETTVTVKPVELKVTKLSPKQKVFDLAINEESEITVESVRYEAPAYDAKVGGWKNGETLVTGTAEEFEAGLLAAASALIQPVSKQIEAFLYRATQESYQDGKTKALSTGNYLTQDLRGKIVQIMRGNNTYADMKATDCFDRWKTGYLAGKPGAIKVLTMAQDFGEFGDL